MLFQDSHMLSEALCSLTHITGHAFLMDNKGNFDNNTTENVHQLFCCGQQTVPTAWLNFLF